MKKLLRALQRDRKGATAIEYGLLAALIALAIMASVQGVADSTLGMWNDVDQKFDNAQN